MRGSIISKLEFSQIGMRLNQGLDMQIFFDLVPFNRVSVIITIFKGTNIINI